MTSIRLSSNTEHKLQKLCQLTKRTKSFYIKEALDKYLDDMEDTYIALERISQSDREFMSSEEILNKLEKGSV